MRSKILLGALVVVLSLSIVRTIQKVSSYQRSERVCDAASEGLWTDVLTLSEGFSGSREQVRRVQECRCLALAETENVAQCTAEIETLRMEPAHSDWLPTSALTALLVEQRRSAGDVAGATRLARQGVAQYPESVVLGLFELELRSLVENEETVLRDFTRRLGPETPEAIRVRLAEVRVERREWEEAIELTDPLPTTPDLNRRAKYLRGMALSMTNRVEELRALHGIAEERSQTAPEDLAQYAQHVAHFNIVDPKATAAEMLAMSLESPERFEDQQLLESTFAVYMQHLASSGRSDELPAVLKQAEAALGHAPSRFESEEVERLAALPTTDRQAPVATLEFSPTSVTAGDYLLISPDATEATETPYERYEVLETPLTIERRSGAHPVRWVLRSANGETCGSGSRWPLPGRSISISLERPEACEPPPSHPPPQLAPADGRTRVVAVMLDSAEWRLVRLLQARGELPTLSDLEARGVSGTIDSTPPYTAAALRQILYPRRSGVSSILALTHQMGTEIEGLNFVGANPFSFLDWVLPEDPSMVEELARAGARVASVLRSFGRLETGRQAEILGPGEVRERLSGFSGSRFLDTDEIEGYFAEEPQKTSRSLLAEMAADFDTLEKLTTEGDLDLVLLRVASMDVLTHTYFQRSNRPDQDHGTDLLLSTYRYADYRLGRLQSLLDRDDVFLVLSDHGSRTALEHHPSALLFLAGHGVPVGQLSGNPGIKGFGRLLSTLLGLDLDLPSTGMEDWSTIGDPLGESAE